MMSSLASAIESSLLPPSTHLCWTLSLVNPLLRKKAKKIVGCRCSGLKCIGKKELIKITDDNFDKKGQLCLEGKDKKVYVRGSGAIMFKNGNEFIRVVNCCGNSANIYENIRICLCDGCQTMSSGCTNVFDIGGILSSGWHGLYFYISTTV